MNKKKRYEMDNKETNGKRANTRRRGIVTLAALLAMTFTSQAQVFIMDGEADRAGTGESGVNTIIPIHNVEYDQENDFVPLGGGVLAFTGLGLCYLLRKNRKE